MEISSKLDKVLKLMALNAVKDLPKEREKIELLDSVGFSSSEIGKALNKSTENVCTVLKTIKTEKSDKVEEKTVKKATKESGTTGQESLKVS
jgi:DNA-directed RNA polymerase specialized sigma24 family protein